MCIRDRCKQASNKKNKKNNSRATLTDEVTKRRKINYILKICFQAVILLGFASIVFTATDNE